MEYVKCKFTVDTIGFYVTPLIGYARIKGVRQLYVGWGSWLGMIEWKVAEVIKTA